MVVQSMLANTKSIQQSIVQGCDKYMGDHNGWKRITPCPAHAVCGQLGNAFAHGHTVRILPAAAPHELTHYPFFRPIAALPTPPPLLDQSFCPSDTGYSILPSMGSPKSEPSGLLGRVIHTYDSTPVMAAPGLPSLLDHYKPTVDEPTGQPLANFPSPATASVLPASVYAEYTTRPVVDTL